MTRVFETNSADETRALAAALGSRLRPGDVLCLIGDLGAGKTTWTQGLALGLGLPPEEPVNSPTFTLLAEHPGGRVPLYHFDVYRLPDSSGLYDLAFDEYLSGDGVVVIEWADKIADALPPERIDIALTVEGPDKRRIVMTAHGARAEELWTDSVSLIDTQVGWRDLGFFANPDDPFSEWQIAGSKAGLSTFCDLLQGYAEDPGNGFVSDAYLLPHEHYGPYMSLTIQTWDKPLITDRGIYGGLADLKRLSEMVRQRLELGGPGDEFIIGSEYAQDSKARLKFEIKEDGFDPASADDYHWIDAP